MERGPGENVILVSWVTQRPRLPDGALEGLAQAARLHPQTRLRSSAPSHTQTQTDTHDAQIAERHLQSGSKHSSCDTVC